MKHMRLLGFALLALLAGVLGESVAVAAPPKDGPERPVRVLLFAGGPTREYQFLRGLFVEETERKRAELSVCLQRLAGTSQTVPGVPVERVLKQFPSLYDPDKETEKPEAKFTNLDHYDVLIAIDADWMKLSDEQLKLLNKWVDNGGGLIVVGGPTNTLQLARPGPNREKLRPILDLLPVVLKDIRIEALDRSTEAPWPLIWNNVTPEMDFLNLTEEKDPAKGWKEFFYGNNEGKGSVTRGFHNYYPTDVVKAGSVVVARFGDPRSKTKDGSQMPFLVLNAPASGRCVVWLGWGETWRLRQYRADYYTRFWTHLVRYAAANRPSANKLIALPAKLIEPPPGLTPAEKHAVDKALAWLVKAQTRDGHWENKCGEQPTALTGLAGMALLMDGNTLSEGKHAVAVRRAVDYLIFHGQPNGLIGDPKVESERTQYLIGHAFALQFLAQCYDEDEDVDRRKKMEEVLTKAVELSCQAQNNNGGWGSVSAKEKQGQADVLATLVQLQALRAVRNAGFAVSAAVLNRARGYLEKEVEPSTPSSAAAVALVFGTGPYDTPLARKWLKAAPAPAPLGEGKSLRDEYLNFGQAQLAYSLADTGYEKLFPDSKPNERLTWSSYRKTTFAALLKAQSADGSWSDGANGVHATALYLAILQLPENTLPVFSTSQ